MGTLIPKNAEIVRRSILSRVRCSTCLAILADRHHRASRHDRGTDPSTLLAGISLGRKEDPKRNDRVLVIVHLRVARQHNQGLSSGASLARDGEGGIVVADAEHTATPGYANVCAPNTSAAPHCESDYSRTPPSGAGHDTDSRETRQPPRGSPRTTIWRR